MILRRVPACHRWASSPGFAEARRLPKEDMLGLADRRRGRAAASSRSPCRTCPGSPTSRTSTRSPGAGSRPDAAGARRGLAGDTDLVAAARQQGHDRRPRGAAPAGWDIDILAHAPARRLGVGLCGGYQMLGREVPTAPAVEGTARQRAGARAARRRDRARAEQAGLAQRGIELASGLPVQGYEIHLGRTWGPTRPAVAAARRRAGGRHDRRAACSAPISTGCSPPTVSVRPFSAACAACRVGPRLRRRRRRTLDDLARISPESWTSSGCWP